MIARKVKSSSPKRVELYQALPLEIPFSIHIFTSYYCDFQCMYCPQSLDNQEFNKMFREKSFMSAETFKKTIDGMKEFEEEVKTIILDGWGEPLLNPELPNMIKYAKDSGVAERIELVSNGYSLTSEKARQIVAAGLDRIRISIQGLSEEKYKEISNVTVDFKRFCSQLAYLYSVKQQLSIYIKIIDVALDGNEEQVFYDLFERYCDDIAVEHMVPTAERIDYGNYKDEFHYGQQGYKVQKIHVCPFPFYMMVVEPDGEVKPCCATRHPVSYGNVNKQPLSEIWGSTKMIAFWKRHLGNTGRKEIAVCKECMNPDYGVQPGDIIDPYREFILERLEE